MKSGNRYGYIGHDGKLLIQPQFDGAVKFSEGLGVIILSQRIFFDVDMNYFK